MADENDDSRPRRRLFGRRRHEDHDDPQVETSGPGTADPRPSDPAPAAGMPPSRPSVRDDPTPEAPVTVDPEPVIEPAPVTASAAVASPAVEVGEVEVTEVEVTGVILTDDGDVVEIDVVEVEVAEVVSEDPADEVEEPTPVADSTPDSTPDATLDATPDAEEPDEAPAEPEPPAPEAEAAAPEAPAPEARAGSAAPEADLPASDEPQGPLPLPRVIAVANQKGGVGKTTTAVNLGASLAELGLRVLVVDLDPQGNASTGLGINPRDVDSSIYDVIMNDTPALDAVEPTSLKNLFVIPATLDLAGAEIELVPAFSRELKLKRALDAVRPEYDVVLIDCPPSLGLLTVNGLAAADDVIVPIQCEYYALEGLGQLLRNVALVRSSLNPELDVRGIILTMFDSRTRLAEQVEREVREHFGTKVYKTVVPRTVRLAEAPSFGQPIIVFDSTSRGAKAYRKLAKEVSGGATRRAG